jgi:hypothetical protein
VSQKTIAEAVRLGVAEGLERARMIGGTPANVPPAGKPAAPRIGNGAVAPPTPQDEWLTQRKARWMCGWKDCDGGPNRPANAQCYRCGRDKNAAVSPPDVSMKVGFVKGASQSPPPPAAPPQPKADEVAKAERRKAKNQRKQEKRRAKRENDAPPAAGAKDKVAEKEIPKDAAMAVDEGAAPAADATPVKLVKDEMAALKALGLTEIAAETKAETLFTKPKAKPVGSPAEEVEAESGKDDTLEQAQSNLEELKGSIADLEKLPAKAAILAMLKPQLKALEDKVEECKKKAEAGKDNLSLSCLKSRKFAEENKEEVRLQKYKTNADAAQARYERLRGVVVAQQELLAAKLDTLQKAFTDTTAAWNVENDRLANLHRLKLETWESKIAEAEAANGGVTPPPPAMDPSKVALPCPLLTIMQQPPPECYLATQWDETQLPPIVGEITDNMEMTFSSIMANVRAWQCHGSVPIPYKALVPGCDSDRVDEVIPSFKSIIGEVIWTNLYGERVVTVDSYVPFQVGVILREALDRVREKITASKYTKGCEEKASASFAEKFQNDAKRRKAVIQAVEEEDAI